MTIMNKKQTPIDPAQPIDALQTITTATELAVQELASDDARASLIELADAYKNTIIPTLTDKTAVKFVQDGAKRLKKARTSIEAKRKELKAPAIQYGKAIDEAAKELVALIEPTEKEVNQRLLDWENAVEAERQKMFRERSKQLTENGYQIAGKLFMCGPFQFDAETLTDMEQSDFEMYLQKGTEAVERKKAEEQRLQAEKEAIEKERAEIERLREELRLEREKLRNEQSETSAQKEAIEQTYAKVETGETPTTGATPIATTIEGTPEARIPAEVTQNDAPPFDVTTPAHSIDAASYNAALDDMRVFMDTTEKLNRTVITNWLMENRK